MRKYLQSVYDFCCGDSEDQQTQRDVHQESHTNGVAFLQPTSASAVEEQRIVADRQVDQLPSTLSSSSVAALHSFLKHQLKELMPRIIEAEGLDPLDVEWKAETRSVLFKVVFQLGPLNNLSQLVYDKLEITHLGVTYNETLHLDSTMVLHMRMRKNTTLDIRLRASVAVDPKDSDSFEQNLPIRANVKVHGVRFRLKLHFAPSLDIDWIEDTQSIESTLKNEIELQDLNIQYDHIGIEHMTGKIDQVVPVLWAQIEEEAILAITRVFDGQIKKALKRTMEEEMHKVLRQISSTTPTFHVEFGEQERSVTQVTASDHDAGLLGSTEQYNVAKTGLLGRLNPLRRIRGQ